MLTGAATGAAGILGGVPAMWVIMASTLAFAGMAVGLFTVSAYRQKETPEGKLRYNGTIFNFDLFPVPDNRKTRRVTASAGRRVIPTNVEPLIRELQYAQLGIELINYADFPMSLIVESADTEVEGKTPPRARYPKPPITVLPGIPVRVCDDRIDVDRLKCDRLEGKMRIAIKYGRSGKEIHELKIRAQRVDVLMQPNGFCAGTHTGWEEDVARA